MTTITATVRGGRIEVAEPINLPDGTELRIPLPEAEPDAPMSAAEIARVVSAMDRMERVERTDAERAAWDAERAAQREREKADFAAEGERLKRMWDDPVPPR